MEHPDPSFAPDKICHIDFGDGVHVGSHYWYFKAQQTRAISDIGVDHFSGFPVVIGWNQQNVVVGQCFTHGMNSLLNFLENCFVSLFLSQAGLKRS